MPTLTPSSAAIRPPQEPEPSRWSRPSPAIGRFFALTAAATALLTTACSTRHDPHYNIYDQGVYRDRTALENIEDLEACAEQALDNLERRIENIVY